MVACSTITYLVIAWLVPYSYTYNLSEVEHVAYELSNELPFVEIEEATFWLQNTNDILYEKYDDEFELHMFQSTGKEVSLHDLNTKLDAHIKDYNKVDTTQRYETSFKDSSSLYILLLSRNTNKTSQVIAVLNKALPVLSVVIVFVSIVFAFFFSWYITAPIKKVSIRSKKMANMDFGGRITNKRIDEIGVLSNSLDILSENLNNALTDLQTANAKLQDDIDMERQLERQRLEFFSAVSHELKTPITIIKGQLQGMLCEVGRYKDRETYLAKSIEVTETLEKMVQELLMISRLETPGYVCNKVSFDLSKLLGERFNAHEDLLVQKDITLVKNISSDIKIYGDMQLLQKAIDNLISNALIYSPEGNVVTVNLSSESEKIYLSIENTGVHIPNEVLPKLFEAFYRVDLSRNRQTGGSGLGLYIVKTILDLHNAQMQIDNSTRGVRVLIEF